MPLRRSITQTMESWFEQPSHKALLVTGARQVGKTFAIREFAKDHYDSVLEINFAETPSAREIFEQDLDADSLIANLTAFTSTPLTPGRTLVFLDEIQECPRARTAIKFLVDDGRFDYIESGSLLGVLSKDVPSLPVGYENVVRMYPLDLSEFFDACGVQRETIEQIRDCFDNTRAVPKAVHDRIMRLTRIYLTVGGMPAVVDRFVQTSDLAQVMHVQRDILELYRLDVAKYAPNKPHVRTILDAVPAQLSKANKRFKLRDLARTARMERYESDFMWLVDAGVTLPCLNTRAPQPSLALNEQHNLFKLYLCDVGLLGATLETPVQFELLNGDAGINFGAVLENYVAQELTAHGQRLRYFDKSRYGEVDFILPGPASAVPLEVKSGADYHRHKALDNILEVSEWAIEHAYVLCPQNVEQDGKITYLPWYMSMFIAPSELDEPFVVTW